MDKIYCNRCGRFVNTTLVPMPENANSHALARRAFLTNCCHVFCIACKNQVPNECFKCRENCSFINVDENIALEFRHLFGNAIEVFKNFRQMQHFQQQQSDIKRDIVFNLRRHYRRSLEDEQNREIDIQRQLATANMREERSRAILESLNSYVR